MKRLALLLLLGAFATVLHAGGWTGIGGSGDIYYVADFEGEIIGPMKYSRETVELAKANIGPLKSFDEVLEAAAKANHLQKVEERGIGGGGFLEEGAFQDELFAALKKGAPKQLQEALKSSGNMHNPKMYELWEPFQKAVLDTPTIAKLNISLGAYGLHISGVSVPEKLELRKAEGGRRYFWGMGLGLKVSKVSGKTAPTASASSGKNS